MTSLSSTPVPAVADEPIKATPGRVARFRRYLRRHPSVAIGGGLLIVMPLIGILAPLLWTTDPTAISPARRTRVPSELYWFGTDMLGRDIYSRVVYGARVSLFVGFSVAILSSVVGLAIGLVSGFVRRADGIIMRIIDGMMSIPPILLAIALMALTKRTRQIDRVRGTLYIPVALSVHGVDVNLRQLKYFVRVVETANMTRAAEELRIAQPALGMQIKQLEETLGVALLTRHSRGVSPTVAGEKLFQRAVQILDLVEIAQSEVRDDARETIRFGLTPSLMQIIGPELLLRVSERAPELAFSLSEEMSHILVDSLHRAELDLVLAYEVPDAPAFWKRALYQEDLVLVTAAGNADDAPITFAEALAGPLILPELRDGVRSLVEKTAAEHMLAITIAHEIRSISGIKTMIARGSAAGILPYGTVLAEVAAGGLVARPIVAPVLRRTLYLAGSRKAGRLAAMPIIREVVGVSMGTLSAAMAGLGHPLSPAEPPGKA